MVFFTMAERVTGLRVGQELQPKLRLVVRNAVGEERDIVFALRDSFFHKNYCPMAKLCLKFKEKRG